MENLSVHPTNAASKSRNWLNFRSFCAFLLTFEKSNVGRIFTTVFEFQNRNIYLFLFDTDASCQRYEVEQGSIHAGGPSDSSRFSKSDRHA
jgi:hypothetical protein